MRSVTIIEADCDFIFRVGGNKGLQFTMSHGEIANSLSTFGMYGIVMFLLDKEWINKDVLYAFIGKVQRDYPDTDIDWDLIYGRITKAFTIKEERTYFSRNEI